MIDIKLQPVPRVLLAFVDQDNPDEWETLCAVVRNYAREAVRLNATALDAREMFNAGWCAAARFCGREDVVYDGLVGPGGSPAFEAAYRGACTRLTASTAHPSPAQQKGASK
jgi:hypothetical protein